MNNKLSGDHKYNIKSSVLSTIILALFLINNLNACTTFIMQNRNYLLFGRNFDYDLGMGLIVINNKGIKKQAFTVPPYKPATWISVYGSITFNQIGIDAPMGGMNEKGLVIAQMALPDSEYPAASQENIVNQLEWIQYQLDNSETLEDVLQNNSNIHIVPISTPVHYMICDADGNMGVLEFLEGRPVMHKNSEFTIPVCSNLKYEDTKSAVKLYKGFGGSKDIPIEWHDINDIIAIATSMINDSFCIKKINPVSYAFQILRSVGSPERTQWQVIYDIGNKKIYYRSKTDDHIKEIDMKEMDFCCNSLIRVKTVNMESRLTDNSGFIVLDKSTYRNYKTRLLKWYSSNIKNFPEIPEKELNNEIENIFNRNYLNKISKTIKGNQYE